MPVYVAKNFHGKPISVVFAKSLELANAFWHGRGVTAHTVRTIQESDLVDHPTGVLPVVNTREVDIKRLADGKKLGATAIIVE